MPGHLLSCDDLDAATIDALLGRAADLAAGGRPKPSTRNAALFFLEPSLRTRAGFLAAAQRLGWPAPAEIAERRTGETSKPESLDDTVAVLSGYFDTIILRSGKPIASLVPSVRGDSVLINAGDAGPAAEHPTQALIDAFAMKRLVGELSTLSVVLCGDLRMRAARSLGRLLRRTPPAELVLVTDPALVDGLDLVGEYGDARVVESFGDLTGVDALHAVGIPHASVSEAVRARLRVDQRALARLSGRGRVFSPMPVIDEVAHNVRADERVAYLAQSALGLPMRTAILESLGDAGPQPV